MPLGYRVDEFGYLVENAAERRARRIVRTARRRSPSITLRELAELLEEQEPPIRTRSGRPWLPSQIQILLGPDPIPGRARQKRKQAAEEVRAALQAAGQEMSTLGLARATGYHHWQVIEVVSDLERQGHVAMVRRQSGYRVALRSTSGG